MKRKKHSRKGGGTGKAIQRRTAFTERVLIHRWINWVIFKEIYH